MKLKNLIIPFLLIVACAPSTSAAGGNVSMITYYPAPNGIYDRLALTPSALPLTCEVGQIIVDDSTKQLNYCHYNNGNETWGPFSNIWTINGNTAYPTNTIPLVDDASADPRCQPCVSDPATGINCLAVVTPSWCTALESTQDPIFIGMGTSTPEAKLTLDNDGGILAMGTFGSGELFTFDTSRPITSSDTPPQLIWYPRKAAFLAGNGYAASSPIDDSNISPYSVVFGSFTFAGPTAGAVIAPVSAGDGNTVTGNYSTVSGGYHNNVEADFSTITGGESNIVSGQYSVAMGQSNNILSNYSVAGGEHNEINSAYATIPGGSDNFVAELANYSTISGGSNNFVTNNSSIIGGTSYHTTIAGGSSNTGSRGDFATIGGGGANLAKGPYAYIGGGYQNNNTGTDDFLTHGSYSVIGGGSVNRAEGSYSVVNGGLNNYALGNYSSIGGGTNNTATGNYSFIGGGDTNTTSGLYSVVAGGTNNSTAGDYSWVAGKHMVLGANADRTFVWGISDADVSINVPDAFILAPGGGTYNPKLSIGEPNPTAVLNITATSGDYLAVTSTSAATTGDIFMIKSSGNVGIGNNNPSYPLQIGNIAGPQGILTNGGVWTVPSSREYKTNIHPLDTGQAIAVVKALKPVTYHYKIDQTEHHVGFIAEDVPELVAENDRRSLNPMNVTAVLTAVLKDQKKTIQNQEETLNILEEELQILKAAAINR